MSVTVQHLQAFSATKLHIAGTQKAEHIARARSTAQTSRRRSANYPR